jgi:hypothetical protein
MTHSGEFAPLTVEPVVVVYALRYALPRASGALHDVVPAVKAAWPHMDAGLRSAVRSDVQYAWDKTPRSAVYAPEREVMVDLLRFIDATAVSDRQVPSDG